ncbi:MAG TPA: ribonuclease III domain-containing protein, partial [Pirellulaceae bacterium]|nr:ribonuclease III domain-containing protein [Pirellulaceae bacterium]
MATDGEEPVIAELIGEPILAEEVAIDRVQLCERRIGYTFRDRTLLQNALTHASGALHRLASNERMEFLGDSVLGLVICEMLYQRFPQFLEGDLTRIKSVVVS